MGDQGRLPAFFVRLRIFTLWGIFVFLGGFAGIILTIYRWNALIPSIVTIIVYHLTMLFGVVGNFMANHIKNPNGTFAFLGSEWRAKNFLVWMGLWTSILHIFLLDGFIWWALPLVLFLIYLIIERNH